MQMKSFEQFQKDAGHQVEEKIHEHTNEVMYEYSDETINSNDIWKSQHLNARLLCTRQLNCIMRSKKNS